jgi:hypothetical protein
MSKTRRHFENEFDEKVRYEKIKEDTRRNKKINPKNLTDFLDDEEEAERVAAILNEKK